MATVLEARNLTKRYWDFTLDDLDLVLPAGRITGLVGPSGAGKTTLIKLIMNLIPADAGTIEIFGLRHDLAEKEIKNRIGFVGEEPLFFKDKTIAWTGQLAAELFARWDGSRFADLLAEFKLSPQKKIKELSRGQRTMFAVAIALSHHADLFLLDEPTAGLDLMVRRKVLELLREEVEGGDEERTVLISSHNTDGLFELADRVVFLDRGRLVLEEDKDDLLARWKWIHYRNGDLGDLADSFRALEQRSIGNTGLTADYPAIRERLAESVAAGEVRVENASLDDILIQLIRGA